MENFIPEEYGTTDKSLKEKTRGIKRISPSIFEVNNKIFCTIFDGNKLFEEEKRENKEILLQRTKISLMEIKSSINNPEITFKDKCEYLDRMCGKKMDSKILDAILWIGRRIHDLIRKIRSKK